MQNKKIKRPIKVGFLLIGDGQWRGGINYQRTVLQAIGDGLKGKVEAKLFVAPSQLELATDAFGDVLDDPPIVDPRVLGAGKGCRAIGAMLVGRDRLMSELFLENEVDLVFETARFFGRSFPIKILAWMPDFQHRYLPELFDRSSWWKREIGFQAQARSGRHVMLSSRTAKIDCEEFYPTVKGRTHVVRFAPALDPLSVVKRVTHVRQAYHLPQRYFYMPNQFWAHKNHSLVLKALLRLRDAGRLNELPPIIMTGPVEDPRNPGLFARTMNEAKQAGIDQWFRHLGLIVMDDVLALNAGSLAVLNPSLFEGWASSVEEAKSLGSTMILSDIPVHREQAPEARFIDPHDENDVAAQLLDIAKRRSVRQNDFAILRVENERRKSEFVQSLNSAFHRACEL